MPDLISGLAQATGRIGAQLSCLDGINSILSTSRLEFAGAESQVKDVDVAVETAKFASLKIRQNMLAAVNQQINSGYKIALMLLRN